MDVQKNSSVIGQYLERVKEAGEIVRSAKQEILGEKAFLNHEYSEAFVRGEIKDKLVEVSRRLPKYVSNEACEAILSLVQISMSHPELINTIEHSVVNSMRKFW
jgi:hypothetical protein